MVDRNQSLFPHERLHIYRYKGLEILSDHAAGDETERASFDFADVSPVFPEMKFGGAAINVLDLGANNGGFPLLLQTVGIRLKKSSASN